MADIRLGIWKNGDELIGCVRLDEDMDPSSSTPYKGQFTLTTQAKLQQGDVITAQLYSGTSYKILADLVDDMKATFTISLLAGAEYTG